MKYLVTFLLTISLLSTQSQTKYERAIGLIENAQLPQAVALFKQMKDSLEKGKHYKEFFEAQYYLAVSYMVMDRNPQAAEDSLKSNLNKAINLAGEESLEAAEMYFGLGWLYDNTARTQKAEQFYLQALKIQEKELGGTTKKTIKTKVNYAQVLAAKGKLGRAEQYLTESLNAYPKHYPKGHGEYVRLYTLAYNFYQSTNQIEKALSYALAALDLGEKNYGANNPRVLSLLRNVSYAHYSSNKVSDALEFANKELLLINQLIGDAPHIRKAEVFNNMGQFYSKTDQPDASEDVIRQALAIKQELLGGQHPSTINSSINLAFALKENQKLDESDQLLDKIFDLLEKSETDKLDIKYQRAVLAKCENLVEQENHDLLRALTNEFFELFKSNISPSMFGGDRHINVMAMIENLSALSNYESAPISELREISEKIYWMDSINSEALERMNLQSDQLNFLTDYSAFNGVAIDHLYELYNRTQDKKYLSEIYRFSEKNKATILSPEFTIARLRDRLNVPMEILEEERRLLGEIISESEEESQAALKKKLAYDSLKDILRKNHPDYYSLKYNQQPTDLKSIQNEILNDHIILSYAISEKHLYRIDIRNTSVAVHRQQIDSLAKECIEFQNRIVSLNDIESIASKLYGRLIPKDIKHQKRLIISPQDFLSVVPFDLLYTGNDYVGIVNPISYTPSLEMWMKASGSTQLQNAKALAVAPDFGNRSDKSDWEVTREMLVPIPGAEEELAIITSNYYGESLKGAEATVTNFVSKVPSYGIVHLATHAIIDNDNPNLSRLYFSESTDSTDPFLYNYELYNLDIRANLVTLSACNTGVGEIQKGDGVNSLARGFIYAGVPATVVSLWPASDKSTPELMKYFYQNLKDGQAKDVALNNARKSYLATATGKARHPFYWGGFVLIGDSSPIEEDRNLLVWFLPIAIILVLIGTILRRKRKN